MPEIFDALVDEQLPEVDYNAPEMGAFQPLVFPGTYPFIFNLDDDTDKQFQIVERGPKGEAKKKYLEVQFVAAIPAHEISPDSFVNGVKPEGIEEIRVNYQRVNTYQTAKMVNSFMGELLRSLKLKISPMTSQGIVEALRENSGKVRGLASFKWKTYCKNCEIEISTNARNKDGQAPWPMDANHKPELMAKCPGCGQGYYGNLDIGQYRIEK